MLVLTRNVDEGIRIGKNIRVVIVGVKHSGAVQVGIDAPKDVPIWRDELAYLLEDEDHGAEDR